MSACEYSALIALGSNLGDRMMTLSKALKKLDHDEHVKVIRVSSAYESVALTLIGFDANKPAYINAVARIDTTYTPLELLEALHAIEQSLGRVRTEKWEDRIIDLDIVDYDGRIMSSDVLTLPHPHAHERVFVLVPWLEIDEHAHIPTHGSAWESLEKLEESVLSVGKIPLIESNGVW